ncbi:uncharacterized protein FOMMEDRAFT_126603 [Fomitiporia mediterranea MF3/22]|uniref:uncharacterized protein n=1 Tax=Fomitiporia mediterranea (strain MF3/22) TaxID=694068 RepID=UPI00044097F0|nr:uncharacterized protein FOMMEDRAFT_126603 [Fomitiporia mediterranea MF3/22]EJD01568.1 hypothetical protein FOMMEDRAFT_126603 [Fomitiporia mediterranea MF3/22]
MDSLIEVQRQTHEEIERFERALAVVLAKPSTTQQAKLSNEHKASQVLDRISSRVHTLHNLYQDEPVRKAEIDAISGSKPDDLSEFYARLAKIKEHHLKYPDQLVGSFELDLAALVNDNTGEAGEDDYEEEDPISLLFSGEEAYGRYLDLYTHHSAYTNLKNLKRRPTYLQYLDILAMAEHGLLHQEVPIETRHSKEYESYITGLHSYLLSFAKKSQPLVDVTGQQRVAEAEFESLWADRKVEGWEDPSDSKLNGVKTEEGEGVWCSACQKQYSKQTVYDAHLTSKKHIKAAARQTNSDSTPTNRNGTLEVVAGQNQKTKEARIRNAALYTFLSTSLILSLLSIVNETKSNVERRFSLTAKEREAELLENAAPAPAPAAKGEENGNEEEEEEERIYNPLKLPLGWDGKPIPYWLYKLHGLGVEYRCEICSDHVYMGRKNFDRHFQESRHAFGMRALGLPNTKHFHEITRIEDALALAEKLKREGKQEIFQQETMEELEDDEGNVYNRKTYDDLKKQGLI